MSLAGLVISLFGIGLTIIIGTIGSAFVIAAYIALFGFPIALVMQDHLRSIEGLLIAMVAAFGATGAAAYFLLGRTSWQWELTGALLLFALPAAVLYRRYVIRLLDEIELD